MEFCLLTEKIFFINFWFFLFSPRTKQNKRRQFPNQQLPKVCKFYSQVMLLFYFYHYYYTNYKWSITPIQQKSTDTIKFSGFLWDISDLIHHVKILSRNIWKMVRPSKIKGARWKLNLNMRLYLLKWAKKIFFNYFI